MYFPVLFASHDLQIACSIISFVSVAVMHNFV